jgi:hypothetical protein
MADSFKSLLDNLPSVIVFSVQCSCPTTEHYYTDTDPLMTTFGRAGDYIWEGNDYIWEGMRLHLGGYATTFGRGHDYIWEGHLTTIFRLTTTFES